MGRQRRRHPQRPRTPAPAMSVSGDDLDAVPPEGPAGPQQPFGTPEPGFRVPDAAGRPTREGSPDGGSR